ncbi:MAG: hypothetical protein B7Y42_14605 [Polaromonas sp. 28-63-22]|nr:MAG: hypothetical protein B7Y42_14605 [Polaromonas sp. 28-63-22]
MPPVSPSINLTHHFLIAMPGLDDEAFAKSVIYMCEHTDRGALGLIINKPSDINLKGLFDKVELPLRREDLTDALVFQGGGGLEMTTSKDVLEALSTGAGPRRVFVSLGYSAWGEGQLESEISDNSWLTVPADMDVIFNTPASERYDKALLLLGVQSWTLSPEAGHA